MDSDSPSAYQHFAASRAVDATRLPASLRSWQGRSLRLGGPQGTCMAAISALRVLAERRGLTESIATAGDDPADVADQVMSRGHPVLVGELDGGCPAAWAVPADSVVPLPWTITPPPGARSEASRIARRGEPVVIEVEPRNDPWEECPEHASFAVLLVGGRAPEELANEPGFADVRAAVDIDRDGWPELVLEDRWLRRVLARREYERVEVLNFPLEYYECIE